MELAKGFDVFHGDRIAISNGVVSSNFLNSRQMEGRVQEHRGMTHGEDKSVTIWPYGIFWIEAKEFGPNGVCDRCHCHSIDKHKDIGLS